MNLEQFDTVIKSNQGAECALRDIKTGRPTDAVVVLRGMDSDQFKAIKADRARDATRRAEAGQVELTQDDRDDMAADTAARMTVTWRGLSKGGQPLEFSVEAARQLYRQFPAIREQVSAFISDRANFVQA